MDFETYSAKFTQKATENGFSAENIAHCLNYARPLLNNSLPVIYNPVHLAALVGYKTSYFARAIVFTPFFYRHFKIRKNDKSFRLLSEPLPNLKNIQYWILENVLNNVQPSKYAKAYIQGRGIKQNLVFHRDQSLVLKLDIFCFFDNIRRVHVERLFRKKMNYSLVVSNLMAKLCCLNECLPQGAPTSPSLSNLFMYDFDETIGRFCIDRNIRYTRYADDLTFSGDFNISEVIKRVEVELKELGLLLNSSKTKLMKNGTRKTVTGIVVNEKLQVSKATRNKIRQEIYYIDLFGIQNHIEKKKITRSNYVEHLLGQVLYILHINPGDEEFQRYKVFLNDLPNHVPKVSPKND
jgi:RNA-directed DNA polymerase